MIRLAFIAVCVFGGVFSLEIADDREGTVVLEISGKDAESVFANESGGHRVQRVPPTEKRGRVQTSTITVAVLCPPTEAQVKIKESDLDIQMIRGSGSGGQKRNKTSNCILLKHKPSGIIVRCESERSLTQNRASALALLRSRLLEAQNNAMNNERAANRRQMIGDGQRCSKRRTIAIQRGEVVDHVTGKHWSWRDYERGNW